MTAEVGFEIKALDRSSSARRGSLRLKRGVVETPVFMPVGTQAAIRGLPARFFPEIPITICLANTYHLHQRPGESLIKKLGGLHKFMNTDVPILTDSGGFQVFSLKKKKVSEVIQILLYFLMERFILARFLIQENHIAYGKQMALVRELF